MNLQPIWLQFNRIYSVLRLHNIEYLWFNDEVFNFRFVFVVLQCNSNGLQYEQVISSGSKKTKMLEMFFFGIPRISGLHYFPNLRVFRAVNQNMQTIEGLEACPCLEELWLCECKIKVQSQQQTSSLLPCGLDGSSGNE